MLPLLLDEDRVVPVVAGGNFIPRIIALLGVLRSVVIAEVVLVPLGRTEQVQRQGAQIQRDLRRISIVPAAIQAGGKIHRQKLHAATIEGVVPIAIHVDPSARRRDVLRRHPDPVGAGLLPESRAPGVAAILADPAARHPDAVGGTRALRACFQACRRRREVLYLLGAGVCPEPRDPLVASTDLGPVPGNPTVVGRNRPPAA